MWTSDLEYAVFLTQDITLNNQSTLMVRRYTWCSFTIMTIHPVEESASRLHCVGLIV